MSSNEIPTIEDMRARVELGDWGPYAYYVMETLRELKGNQEKFVAKQQLLESNFIALKTKVIIYGVIAGFIASGLMTLGIGIVLKMTSGA